MLCSKAEEDFKVTNPFIWTPANSRMSWDETVLHSFPTTLKTCVTCQCWIFTVCVICEASCWTANYFGSPEVAVSSEMEGWCTGCVGLRITGRNSLQEGKQEINRQDFEEGGVWININNLVLWIAKCLVNSWIMECFQCSVRLSYQCSICLHAKNKLWILTLHHYSCKFVLVRTRMWTDTSFKPAVM